MFVLILETLDGERTPKNNVLCYIALYQKTLGFQATGCFKVLPKIPCSFNISETIKTIQLKLLLWFMLEEMNFSTFFISDVFTMGVDMRTVLKKYVTPLNY